MCKKCSYLIYLIIIFLHTLIVSIVPENINVIFSFHFRNSQVLTNTKDTSISFDGHVATLKISNVSMEHMGTIKILVENEWGQDESTAELVVGKVTTLNLSFI